MSEDLTRCAMDLIYRHIAKTREMPVQELRGRRSRYGRREIQFARQEVAWLADKLVDASLSQIGRAMGRDHSTILHAIDRIETKRAADPTLAAWQNEQIDALSEPIGRLEAEARDRAAAREHAVTVMVDLAPLLIDAVAADPENVVPALQAIAGVESEPA